MNDAAMMLRDPTFWDDFFESIPSGVARDVEEAMLAEVALRADKPLAFVKKCMNDYLRINVGKLYSLIPPGTDTIH